MFPLRCDDHCLNAQTLPLNPVMSLGAITNIQVARFSLQSPRFLQYSSLDVLYYRQPPSQLRLKLPLLR
jgi:hypothetical protein